MAHKQHGHREKLVDLLRKVEHGAHSAARKLSLQLQPANSEFLNDRDTYTYDFIPAPDQEDPVRELIEEIISKLSDDSARGRMVSNANIRVRPTTTEIPLWPRRTPARDPEDYLPHNYNDMIKDDEKDNTKLYTFFQEMEEFPATVTIRFFRYRCPLEPEKLLVQHGHERIPNTEWLVQLANASYFDKRNAASEICFWYNRGDKPFRLMELPLELRLAIYEHVITPDGEIYPLSKAIQPPPDREYDDEAWPPPVFEPYLEATISDCENARVTLGIGYRREDVAKQEGIGKIMRLNKTWSMELRDYIPAPDISLFFVSKQVHAEALRIAWESPIRCFIDHRMFAAVANSRIGVGSEYNILARIELSFTCRAWFKFFGINQVLPTLLLDEVASLGPCLERLPPKCRLTIRFRNPEDGYEICDPFCDPWEYERDRSSCQVELNAWIMIFAFKHIKHVQNINLTGYIRKLQKKRILAVYQDRYDEDADNIAASALQDILNRPFYKLPPKCFCPKNCTTEFPHRMYSRVNACEDCGEHATITVSDHNFFDFGEDEESDEETR